MPPNLAASRPQRAPIVVESGPELPDFSAHQLALIKSAAAPEDWGSKDAVLLRYLAVHVSLAIEQGRFAWSGDQLVMRAGQLATAGGAAVYLGLTRIEGQRWAITWAGARPGNVEPLLPPDLGASPGLDPRREVAVAMDRFPRPILAGLPLITQNLAVAGAVEWSIRRGLAIRQVRGYFAPVHMTDRAGPPEFAAAIQVQAERLVVRALVGLQAAYMDARVVSVSQAQMPGWIRGGLERNEGC